MKTVGDIYYGYIEKHLHPQPPHTPFFSSVNASVLSKSSSFGPAYWQNNLENPVLFRSANKNLLEHLPDATVHLEVGPHSALSGPLRQIYKEKNVAIHYVSVLKRGQDDIDAFLEAVGQLYCGGVEVQVPAPAEAEVLHDMPKYQWHYDKSYWGDSRVSSSWRLRKHGAHDLLGRKILESSDVEPIWRNILRLADVPWLRDHIVGPDVVFPAAGYISMAGEAIRQHLHAPCGYTVRKVHIDTALVLKSDRPTEIITTLRPQMLTTNLESKLYEFSISSHDGHNWNKLSTGTERRYQRAGCRSNGVYHKSGV